MRVTGLDAEAFILANTTPMPVPLVPEIVIRTAGEAHELWTRTEDELEEIGLPPPFWAFPWAGGQALARHVLDNPFCVSGKRVLDFGAGSGLVGIAAAKAGARRVLAVDIDPFSQAATRLNMALNNVHLDTETADLIGHAIGGIDVVLAGDVFYDRDFAARALAWFRQLAAGGITVIAGDPGRAYRPQTGPDTGIVEMSRHDVPVSRALEDAEIKTTTVLAILP